MDAAGHAGSAQGEGGGIQVISRAAAIMRALENQADGLSLGEIALKVGLARSTVQRIVGALSSEGFLIAASPKGRVRLGPGLVTLARTVDIATDRLVRPILVALAGKCGETVDLSVLEGKWAIFIDQVMGSQRLVAVSAIGERFPLHCTANGKALLACMPAETRERILRDQLPGLTPRTVTERSQLEADLKAFDETQLAWDLEEHAEGICAVGTAFIDPLGRGFAISIPVPAKRFSERKRELGEMLLDARAKCLTAVPGSRPPSASHAAD
jgi:DNA-binding IclR family transcriptional regulator